MNATEATKLVAILTAAYPAANIQPETPTAYALALSDIPYSAAEQAVAMLLRTNKFLPTPAEIREALAEAVVDAAPWEAAWDELLKAIRDYGSYLVNEEFAASVQRRGWTGWSSPAVAEAVAHVGYLAVCVADQKDLPTIRAQFRTCYVNAMQRKQRIVQIGTASLPRGDAGLVALKGGVA